MVATNLDNGVFTITLDDPGTRNALSLERLEELTKVIADIPAQARVVVFEADGPVFSSGHNLGEMIDRPSEFYTELFAACSRMMTAIHDAAQPVIAKVRGPATAAGCQLVASCDLAVAADDAWFATPGVKIGLFCSTPMVPVTRSIGRKRAMEMLLTGDPVPADTAADWGLINRAVPAGELDSAVDALVAKIKDSSADTVRIGKGVFYDQIDRPELDAYSVAEPEMAANAANSSAQEGMSAFLEKRQPVWPG